MAYEGPSAPSVDEFTHYLKSGYSYLQSNNLVEAKDCLEKSLELRPGDDRALNLLAMVFFKLEQYPKAVKIFRQLIKTNPNFPTLYMNLGLAYIKQGDFSSALPELLRVVNMDPEHPNVHNYLGLIYSKLGRYEEAREEFEKAHSPQMVARMEEKIRDAQHAEEYEQQLSMEGAPVEMNFEQPPEAFSTFDAVDRADAPQEYPPAQPEYAQTQYEPQPEPPPSHYTVPLAPPEGVTEEPPPPPSQPPAPEKAPEPPRPEIRSLKELTRDLSISKDNIPALHLRDEKMLQIVLKGGQVFARLGGMVASEGDLSFNQAFKRFKGKETKAIFGGKDDPVTKIMGEGQLLLSSKDHRLSLFNLEDEMIYLAEDAVLAFQDGILWENGRIQTEGAEDLNLVQFKGRGTVSISTRGRLVSIPVTSRSPLTVEFASLVGWFGKIVPQVKIAESLAAGGRGKRIVVGLKGDGDVLMEETFTA